MRQKGVPTNRFRSFALAAFLFALLLAMLLTNGVPAGAKKKDKVDLNGSYHASLGVQMAGDTGKPWIYRFGYYDKELNALTGKGKGKRDSLLVNENGIVTKTSDGDFTDVEIKGNGTYTVSLEGADFQGGTCISQLQVATDIPLNDQIHFSDVKVRVDGKEIVSLPDGVMEDEDTYLAGGMVLLCFNHWRPELIETLTDVGMAENTANGWNLLTGEAGESISVTFTVSGFAYDQEVDGQEGETGDEVTADGQEGESGDTVTADGQEGETGDEVTVDGSKGETSSKNRSSVSSGTALAIILVIWVILVSAVTAARRKKQSR